MKTKKIQKSVFLSLSEQLNLTPKEHERAYYCLVLGKSQKEAAEHFGVSVYSIQGALKKVSPKLKKLSAEQFDSVINNFAFNAEKKAKLRRYMVDKERLVDIVRDTNEGTNLSHSAAVVLNHASFDGFVTITITIHSSNVTKALALESKKLKI